MGTRATCESAGKWKPPVILGLVARICPRFRFKGCQSPNAAAIPVAAAADPRDKPEDDAAVP
jgi:hypothetical protein